MHTFERAYATHSTTSTENKFAGPVIGVKESTKVERQFDELTLKAGEGIIGAQAGFTGGATQAGMNIGKGRGVND